MKQPCPNNADHDTSLFSSWQQIWCHDCKKYYPCPLNGQRPLVTNNRHDRQTSKEQTA